MAHIEVTWACGHAEAWSDGQERPVCKVCGETQVARVKAPRPRITINGAAWTPKEKDRG